MGVISTDLNPNAFVGLSLPFEISNNGDFQKTKTLIEQTRSNIKNLLLTAKGERPMHPTFGSNLRAVLFEPFDGSISDKVEGAIVEAIEEWLPHVSLDDMKINQKPTSPNQVDVELKFSLSYDPSNTEEIVLYNLAANSDIAEGFEGTGDI